MLSGGKGPLTLEEITTRWLFVWDQKFPTGLLSDQEVKRKREATELELQWPYISPGDT